MPEVEAELARRLAEGSEVLVATVVRTDREPPSHAGAKLLLSRTAALAGTLGCSEFDSAALAEAPALLDAGTPRLRTYEHDLGSVEVYLEPHAQAPLLAVAGATPVARELLELAPRVGFRTALLETRPERLAGAPWPGPVVRELEGLEAALGTGPYFVHTDHDAPGLVPLLAAVLELRPRFTGLMGSRRHTGPHLAELRARGVPEEAVAAIRTPVGLEIGAATAGEIALSILAGLVAVRRGGAPGGWKDA
ncbi:MAG: XdhC family protein [Candidatus Dormibacterales bacterium]